MCLLPTYALTKIELHVNLLSYMYVMYDLLDGVQLKQCTRNRAFLRYIALEKQGGIYSTLA